jgi:hypothetical protein
MRPDGQQEVLARMHSICGAGAYAAHTWNSHVCVCVPTVLGCPQQVHSQRDMHIAILRAWTRVSVHHPLQQGRQQAVG